MEVACSSLWAHVTGLLGRHLKGKRKGNFVFWGEKAKFETKNRKAQDREICDVTGILG